MKKPTETPAAVAAPPAEIVTRKVNLAAGERLAVQYPGRFNGEVDTAFLALLPDLVAAGRINVNPDTGECVIAEPEAAWIVEPGDWIIDAGAGHAMVIEASKFTALFGPASNDA